MILNENRSPLNVQFACRANTRIMYPGINRTSQHLEEAVIMGFFFFPDDSVLMGPPADIRRPRSDGGTPGKLGLNVLIPLLLLHCALFKKKKTLLFQHLTNTVCRPTMHTHTHTCCHSVQSLSDSLPLSPSVPGSSCSLGL